MEIPMINKFIKSIENASLKKEEVGKHFSKLASLVAGEIALKSFKGPSLVGKLFAFAITEQHSSNLADIFSTGKIIGDKIQVKGEKTFVTNAPSAEHFLTLIKIEDNLTFVYLSKEQVEIVPIEKFCLSGAKMGKISFNTKIPKSMILGQISDGNQIFHQLISHERILSSYIHLGRMRYLLEAVTLYINKKKLTKKVDLKNLQKQIPLLEKKLKIHQNLIVNLNFAHIQQIAKFKVEASEIYFNFVSEALELLGACALTDPEFEQDLNNALAAKIYSGSNGVLKRL